MPIPAIASYDIPFPVEESRVSWVPDVSRAAILVHDMQNYFLDAYDPSAAPRADLVANIARLLHVARRSRVPVVYSVQPGDQAPPRRGLLADFWGTGMASGPDTAVDPAVAPVPGDMIVTKWRYSAFQRTDLRELLAHVGRDQLVVVGVYAHLGCQATAVEAFMNDIQPFLVADAVADFSADEHAGALRYVARRCGRVLTTAQTVAALDGETAAIDAPAGMTRAEAGTR